MTQNADLIVTAQVIRTADRDMPLIEAFAVTEGRITAVGSREA